MPRAVQLAGACCWIKQMVLRHPRSPRGRTLVRLLPALASCGPATCELAEASQGAGAVRLIELPGLFQRPV